MTNPLTPNKPPTKSPTKSIDPQDLFDIQSRFDQKFWNEYRGKRIFLTGGTGFFGKWLCESFVNLNERLRLGTELCVLTRNSQKFLSEMPHLKNREGLSFLDGDIRTFGSSDFCARFRADFIIHAATSTDVGFQATETIEMISTVVDGTQSVLEYAQTVGTSRLLYISSGAVYGSPTPGAAHFEENCRTSPNPLDRNSAYGEAKRYAELLCTLYSGEAAQGSLKLPAGQLTAVIARCFAFLGPHLPLNAHFAVGNFISDGLKGETIRVNGDGTARRSYLYMSDLTAWLWYLLARGDAGFAYHVGSEASQSIEAIASRVAAACGVSYAVAKKPEAGAQPSCYVPSTAVTRAKTGLAEWTSFDEALKKTIAWHKRG